MRIKRVMIIFGILVLLWCSCDTSGGGSNDPGHSPDPKPDIPPRVFFAENIATSKPYQLTADLLAEGRYCNVWVERGTGVNTTAARSVANAYDNSIYPKMMSTFGITGPIFDYTGTQLIAYNTMELANWLVDGDGKMCILLLDIQDNYQPGVNQSFIAGYFWAGNLFDVPNSNESVMIYIDTYPGVPGSKESNAVLAHEMQHLMNYVSSMICRTSAMDTWIDEGLSSAAEWLYTGEQTEAHWKWYNNDPSGLIQKGNNFFVWGNRENENQYALLDDYATVDLFFQWLRLQAGSNKIYHDIISSADYDYRAVTQAANKAMSGEGYDNWGTLLKTWLAANYVNAPSGKYGYKNDRMLKDIKAKTAPAVAKIDLFPGEGVFSLTNAGFPWPAQGSNIKYSGLTMSTPWLNDTTTYPGGALLTYNANTNTGGSRESGITTGVASAAMVSHGRFIGELLSRPYAIGAGDLRRQNGHRENTGQGFTTLRKGTVEHD